jgi:transcriptional regulator with XRE-family HTH domain
MNKTARRIQAIRKHFKISQEEFGKIIGLSQANISKIEAGSFEPTETTINAIAARLAVNPEWIRTGEGEMLISPENYLKDGIELFGKERIAAGMANLLQSAEYEDLKALVGLQGMLESCVSEEMAGYLKYIVNTWCQGDEKTRHWVEKQLEMEFRGAKREK